MDQTAPSPWHRVFGTSESEPDATALEQSLLAIAPGAAIEWEVEDRGWLRAEIRLAGMGLRLERFFREEEGIRAELQAWAAWLETTSSPQAPRLMQHLIGTRQVFTLLPTDSEVRGPIQQVCLAVCRFLAQATEGVYQIDEQGFFSPDGELLVKEDE